MGRTATIALVAALVLSSGCATCTGTLTGAFTGAVDLPAECYRANSTEFDKYPITHAPNAVILGPLGFATGPAFGFVKGLSLDIQWLIGHVDHADVFWSYGDASIWRPHTIKWGRSD